MNVSESFQSALESVRANKLRSFLTMLGIIIGISSVITIVSIGDGAKRFVAAQFENIGTNIVNLKINSTTDNVKKRDYFTLDDIQLLKEKVPEITSIVTDIGSSGTLKTENNKSKKVSAIGTTADSMKFYSIKIIKGRYLNETDIDAVKNVAAIDDKTAIKLFGDTDIVGKRAKLTMGDKNINVTIIGVFKDTSASLGQDPGDSVPGFMVMPITIGDKIFKYTDISTLSVTLTDMKNADQISSKMVRILENKHQNKGKYSAQQGFKELDTINKALSMLTLGLGAIAGISLVVGGIGVMNIMLVSVTERTREIGIRKAIGAKTRDIKMQFLMESVILCLIGGTIGTIFGIALGKVVSYFIHIDIPVSIKVILIAFGFSSAVGIFFGLYPAGKAAKLDPIEALRYE
ncbi:ABC transporter permease [Clostridiaceae bacterium UIB06]|uniref:ABC transporter permease n=1 Tax=Clostridium thailandense TaxID=2794346 RepID=A0A949WSC0_9CLOT|nr:ABC transporter permease [Clostridium thailandense]MBV7275000.1 ABC transporter permease [Clostridium thailandense]MCH5137919.1 ABC transporter permease [Clostridiaceae bacterium UIB06]